MVSLSCQSVFQQLLYSLLMTPHFTSSKSKVSQLNEAEYSIQRKSLGEQKPGSKSLRNVSMSIWNLWAAVTGFHSIIKTSVNLATDVAPSQSPCLHFVEICAVESSSTAPRTSMVACWHPHTKGKNQRILISLHGYCKDQPRIFHLELKLKNVKPCPKSFF